jgi:MbtH protein
MNKSRGDGVEQYVVVVNEEEQYSVWRRATDPPAGWRIVGEPGSKDACLRLIGELWTDITPRSARYTGDGEVTGGAL